MWLNDHRTVKLTNKDRVAEAVFLVDGNLATHSSVILGLDPRIHHFNDLWMVGSGPTMTKREVWDFAKNTKGPSENPSLLKNLAD